MMKRILAFNGSPRRTGNTSLLLKELLGGANEAGAHTEEIIATEANIAHCRGCLRCNMLQNCVIRDDDWQELHQKIIQSDALIFASPIYFHHLTAPLKKIIDRFRSFIHVQITENGLIHTPWQKWQKQFVLLLCLGSPQTADAQPVIHLFEFMTNVLGSDNQLYYLIGTRLAVVHQAKMTLEELRALYPKLKLPLHLAEQDYHRNQALLKRCYEAGRELGSKGLIGNASFV